MISDLDIYRTAKLWMERHGERAEWAAVERMVELSNADDMEGIRTWERILNAVRELRRREPGNGERMH